jgi:hypothetical protein
MRWIPGRLLRRHDCDDELLDQLAAYIVDVAGSLLSHDENQAALERMKQMLEVNAREADAVLGKDLFVEASGIVGLPSYGDGGMAPHEWLLTEEGRIIKTGAFAHSRDHTLVGRQPIFWDVAGVIVEWELSFDQTQHFLEVLALRGCRIARTPLDFYVACYAAFRLGMMTLCAAGQSGPEAERLRQATNQYREYLTKFSAVER